MEKSHRTIGLLVSGIMDQFTESLCKGAIKECRMKGDNLIVFPGKYLDRDLSNQPEIMYEYQYNTIFEYAKSKQLDGIIVSAGNIGCFAGDERVREMLLSYGDVPCVLVASKWDGFISVNYDNESGVREGLEFLISNMKCERFAMLGGPDGNTDARERKEVFIKVLEENGIPILDRMFAYGSLNKDNPEDCNMLLDNNPDVEAIFCVNDDSALGLYDVMRKRGIIPGRDIKVFGYDNTVAGSKAEPSLSTVSADAVYLGQQAVHEMCDMLDGKPVDSLILPTQFIARDSIGIIPDDNNIKALPSDIDVDKYFDEIFYRCLNLENTESAKLRLKFKILTEQLFAIVGSSVDDPSAEQTLMKNVEKFLAYDALDYADMDDLLLNLEKLYEMGCSLDNDIEKQYRMRTLISVIYRKIIHNMDFKAGKVRNERIDDINSMKVFVRDSLNFRKGNDAAYTALLECIDWLDVNNAYLYVFKEPIPHLYREDFERPDKVYLKAYLKNGNINTVPSNRQEISVEDIFNSENTNDNRVDYVLLPLFYNEMQYGLLLCDLTEKMYSNGEFLTNQMGAAVHMINLLRENEQAQQRLSDIVISLRENNIALDHLSKLDSLTGIHNRRGYMEKANQLILDNIKLNQDTLIAYVDMNNLKVINDRYGHEEGDYSLKLISDIIKGIVGNQGVVGRIGGDEYSFVLTMQDDMDVSFIERRIHATFASHNRKSDKPYNVTVSIGFYKLSYSAPVEFEEALSYADEQLYLAKQNKVRTVEKIN